MQKEDLLREMDDGSKLSPAETARYSRHIMLPEVGPDGQERLCASRVLVVGAGGLGSPVALYLAAGGVGTIGLADFDRVELHNLQRQILHGTPDVGRPKTVSGAERLKAVNPHATVVQHPDGVQAENAIELFSSYDLIVDGSDNFPTRYLNTDAAFLAERPLIYGSIFKFEGQVTVFHPRGGGPCYRCLFPEPPPPGSVPNCGEAGVLGALCGIVGSLQAMEAIKWITGAGESLIGRLLVVDALAMNFRLLRLRKDPDCPLCGARPTIHDIMATRYGETCVPVENNPSGHAEDHDSVNGSAPLEVDVQEAAKLRSQGRATIIDVRESYELDICRIADAQHIPMGQISAHLSQLATDRQLLVLCHVGHRSLHVTRFLRAQGLANVSNIRGGIDAWARELDPSLQRY